MEQIGIDLGGKESQVCVRSADEEIIGEWRLRTDRLIVFLQGRPPAHRGLKNDIRDARVLSEASCRMDGRV